jgi:hypothetical protein
VRQEAGGLEAGHCGVMPDPGAGSSIPTYDAPDLSGTDRVRHGAQGLRLSAASHNEAPELATAAKGVRRGGESTTVAQPATASSSHATRVAAEGVGSRDERSGESHAPPPWWARKRGKASVAGKATVRVWLAWIYSMRGGRGEKEGAGGGRRLRGEATK